MAPIERDHKIRVESLGQHDDGCVGAPEGKIAIAVHDLGDPYPIVMSWRLDIELAHRAQEPYLGLCAEPTPDQIGGFGDDQCGNDEAVLGLLERVTAPIVVVIVSV